jgi:endonuclease YncB( thermonuclease family)
MNTLTLIPESGQQDAILHHVVDGDTFDVFLLVPVRVRLHGVQVAEKSTDKGKLVAAALRDRLTDKRVSLTLMGRDKYGRMMAKVDRE